MEAGRQKDRLIDMLNFKLFSLWTCLPEWHHCYSLSLTELPSCPPHFFSPSCSSLGSCSDPFDSVHFRSLSGDQNVQNYTIIHQQDWILIQNQRIWRGPPAVTLPLASITAQVLNPETFRTLNAQPKPRPIKTESHRQDPESAVFKAPQGISQGWNNCIRVVFLKLE